MKNIKFRNFFGTIFIITIIGIGSAIFSNIHAQNILVRSDNHQQFGRLIRYDGQYFEIYNDLRVIKTFANSCKYGEHAAGRGFLCSFAEFQNGRHVRSDWIYILDSGTVYIHEYEDASISYRAEDYGFFGRKGCVPPSNTSASKVSKWIRLDTVILG